MPLPFMRSRGRRRKQAVQPARVSIPPDQLEFEEQSLTLQYRAVSSHGVRMPAPENPSAYLPTLLEGFSAEVELIEPLDVEFQDAAPYIIRPSTALQWLNAHHNRSAIGRHALYILESLDAIDLAYETFAVALLHGDLDGEAFPRFDAIVGGPVSYWDEGTGELIVRIVLCWGGEGVRGDTQRNAQRLLARLMANMLASQDATELGRVERPVAVAGEQRSSCPHCGFQAIDRRAHFCPKCGLRMTRS